MILRRVIEHVKAQNWFAVALDFVIVVAGVFVGMQVTNWNAARAERRAEAAFLVRLSEDIVTELRVAETFLKNQLADRQNLEAAILKAQGDDADAALTADECLAAWQSHILSDNFSFNGLLSVDALSQSRGLDVISNPELQLALISYQRQMSYHANRARLIAADVQNLVDDYPDVFPRRLAAGDLFGPAACRLDAMRASQEVRNKLQSNHGRRGGIIEAQREQINLLRDLEKMVAAERAA